MMTTSSTTTTTNGGGGGGRDLISELPDSILHSILSYLDITTVLQTVFLSKRWRYLWTTLPFLNFSDIAYQNDFYLTCDFLFFVDRVLIFRNQTSNIHTFHFSHADDETEHYYYDNIQNHMSTWMHILIKSNVQEIHIKINSYDKQCLNSSFTLPMSLVTCTSLKTLRLDFGADFGFVTTQIFPPCFRLEIASLTDTTTTKTDSRFIICLPALKTLHLENLLLGNSVQLLISKCMALETLIMNYCFDGTQKLNICNPQIKSLTIKRMFTEFCEINVSAPKLTSLSCTSNIDFMGVYSFANVSSLMHAKIIIEPDTEYFGDDGSDKYPAVTRKNVIECLRGICNVRCLTLSAALLLELVTEEVPEHLESLQIKPFCNLRYLKLKTSLDKSEIGAITYLLKHCPNLQYLVLKVNNCQNPDLITKEDCWIAYFAPQCTLHRLEFVQISNIIGSVNELQVLKFLLKNAVVLKKMIVLISKKQWVNNNYRFRKFREKLMRFHGESSSSILFYLDTVWIRKQISQRIQFYINSQHPGFKHCNPFSLINEFSLRPVDVANVVSEPRKSMRECWEAELAPQCMMHHLKFVQIWDVVESVNEVEFLKFLLKITVVLKKMMIGFPSDRVTIVQQLLRGSENFIIS